MAVSLSNIRDLLLPELWAMGASRRTGGRVDLGFDYSYDCITLHYRGMDRPQPLFRRSEIEDNIHLIPGEFQRRVEIILDRASPSEVRYVPYGMEDQK